MFPLKMTSVKEPQASVITLTPTGVALFVNISKNKDIKDEVTDMSLELEKFKFKYDSKEYYIPLEQDAHEMFVTIGAYLVLTDIEGTPWFSLQLSLNNPSDIKSKPVASEGEFAL